jgi:curli biogenesis system outer membrane secretion channel CsgG
MWIKIVAVMGLATMFISCAGPSATTSTKIEPVEEAPPAPSLSMPPGWDDAIIDRIKAGEGLKKRVAVMDFEGIDKLEGKADLRLADLLLTSLVKSGRFDVIERSQIQQVLMEQDLGLTGAMDESTAAEVGQLLGAEWVVLGTITSATQQNIDKFGYILAVIEVAVDVRAVDATTGEIMLSQHAAGKNESKIVTTSEGTVVSGAIDYTAAYAKAAGEAVDDIGVKIRDLFPLLGYVVSVDGDRVITDIGEERGVMAGDHFVVFRATTEIIHPVTGEHIGWDKDVLAALIVRTTERNLSTGEVTSKADETTILQPGDLVISGAR